MKERPPKDVPHGDRWSGVFFAAGMISTSITFAVLLGLVLARHGVTP